MSRNQNNKQNTQGTEQKQQQDQLLKVNQIEREIQYYVYKDLENTLLMLGELEQTLETCKNLEEKKESNESKENMKNMKDYLPIAYNKVILQANLSFGIKFDQYNSNKNTHEKVFEDCNNDAIKIFEEVFETNEDGSIKAHADPTILEICKLYKKKDFKTNKDFTQLPLNPITRQAQFNEKSLDKVIWGIQAVDKEFNEIHEKPYPKPKIEELKKKIQERKKFCEEQLKKNFQIPDIDEKIQIEDDKKEEEYKNDVPVQNNKDTLEGIQQDNKDCMEIEGLPQQKLQEENTDPKVAEGSNYGKLGTQPKGVSGDDGVVQGLDDEKEHEQGVEGQKLVEEQHK